MTSQQLGRATAWVIDDQGDREAIDFQGDREGRPYPTTTVSNATSV